MPARLVAIGDVHGDLAATRRALRLAGAVDGNDHWIGGAMTVVQVGDALDRGDDEQAILDLFEKLEREARAAGGAFHWLLGNHETMNAAGDYRYVTRGGAKDFEGVVGLDLSRPELGALPPALSSRAAAFLPGGPYAKVLAGQNAIMQVGDTVFAHAGVLAGRVADVAAANRSIQCWLVAGGPVPTVALDPEGPLWTRAFGTEPADCAVVDQALVALGAKRMVVAHTPQLGGITSACGGKLWRVDVGMSAYYGGTTQVLEIKRDAKAERLRILE